MKIILPKWAEGIQDENVNVLIAFLCRICDQYGYNTEYYICKHDVARIVDSQASSTMVRNLRSYPQIQANIKFGDVLDTKMSFEITKRERREEGQKDLVRKERIFKSQHVEIELTTERAKLIWIYLLGCLNNNLITEEALDYSRGWKNTYGILEFYCNRKGFTYIKQRDQQSILDEISEDE